MFLDFIDTDQNVFQTLSIELSLNLFQRPCDRSLLKSPSGLKANLQRILVACGRWKFVLRCPQQKSLLISKGLLRKLQVLLPYERHYTILYNLLHNCTHKIWGAWRSCFIFRYKIAGHSACFQDTFFCGNNGLKNIKFLR